MIAVAAAFGADQISDPAELTNGFSAALLGAAGIAAVGAVLAAVLLKKPADSPATDSADSEPVAA
jgi:hypothetical protein